MKSMDKVEIVKEELRKGGYDVPSDMTISFLIGYIPEKVRYGWK